MRLDKDTLLNEVQGHEDRMKGPLWSKDDGESDGDWTASLRNDPPASVESVRYAPSSESPSRPLPRPPSMPRSPSPDLSITEILPRLDALDDAVHRLTAAMTRRSVGGDGVPGWLAGVAGDPHLYDGPDSGRKGVCVRILPTTYAQLQATQRRMGLRTVAAAWEFLLRLGLAAAERLPA